MILLLPFSLSLVALSTAGVVGRYGFNYAVPNSHSRFETADGNVIKGSYTVMDLDGILRTVHYTADAVHGFVAHIEEEKLHGDDHDMHHHEEMSTVHKPHDGEDDGMYDHAKIHKDIDDGSYKHLGDKGDDGQYHHKEMTGEDHDDKKPHGEDDGMYDHARIHKHVDDGSYRHFEDDDHNEHHHHEEMSAEEDHKPHDGEDDGMYHHDKHRRDVDHEDDGQYHPEENDGSYHEMSTEESDDGSYRYVHKLLEGEDDGTYNETKGEDSDDGSYRYVFKPEGEDDGSYHENPVEASDDGSYKESESDRLGRQIGEEMTIMKAAGGDVSNRHEEEVEGSGSDM